MLQNFFLFYFFQSRQHFTTRVKLNESNQKSANYELFKKLLLSRLRFKMQM